MELNPSEFYLGQAYDLANKAAIPDKLIFYDPSDLTTHAVITGMTGSGKRVWALSCSKKPHCRASLPS